MAERNTRTNPYIGPRAFQVGEKLFGRDFEIHELLNLLIAERIVLLHAPSGAGKSSLIQAGLFPLLAEESFTVLPVIRLNLPSPTIPLADSFNRYVYSALASLEERHPKEQQLPPEELARLTLAGYLADEAKREPAQPEQDQQGYASQQRNLALIFDQFEEILTVDPNNLPGKTAFFNQLGEALRVRSYWALFAMREDYLPALTPYLRPVPTHLDNTYRLDFLDKASAIQAVREPVSALNVDFAPAAADRLVDDLRRVQVQQPDGTFRDELGPAVEPLQLQVVCYRLWESLSDEDMAIEEEDVQALGDVNASLSEYYNQTVARIAAATGINERSMRSWFQQELITPGGIRAQVLFEPERSAGLENRAISQLINAHLVRSEARGGAIWYELSHDRLIRPVRESNQAWFEANLSMLQKQAALWDEQGRPEGILLRGHELETAEQWAAAHADEVTPIEERFLTECRQAVQREQEAQQLREQSLRAEEESKRAELETARADAESRRAMAEKQRADQQAIASRTARRMAAGLSIVALAAIALLVNSVAQYSVTVRANRTAVAALAEANSANATATQALGYANLAATTAVYSAGQAAQQRDTAQAGLTQIAVQNTAAAVQAIEAARAASAAAVRAAQQATQAAADAAFIELGNQKLTAQAATAMVQLSTQQAIAIQQPAHQNPTMEPCCYPPTPTPGVARKPNPQLSQSLAEWSKGLTVSQSDLALLLAVEANQLGSGVNARAILLKQVLDGLTRQGRAPFLTLPVKTTADSQLVFSPDGQTLAVRSSNQVSLWNPETSLGRGKGISPAAEVKPAAQPLAGIFYDPSGSLNLITVNNTPVDNRPAGKEFVEGIDVSHFNQDIDWTQVKEIGFVFIRATSGTQSLDKQFPNNWFGAKSAGLLVGAYHYFSKSDDPLEQAQFFLNTAALGAGDLPPVLDLEELPDALHPANEILNGAKKWLAYVEEQTGQKPIIFMNRAYFQEMRIQQDAVLSQYPLWIAVWPNQPNDAKKDPDKLIKVPWLFWQYQGRGSMPGISGDVDRVLFNGSLDDLRALAVRATVQQAASGKVLASFRSLSQPVTSPAGSVLAFLSNGAINVVDTGTYQPLTFAAKAARVGTTVLGISDRGKYLALDTPSGPMLMTFGEALAPLPDVAQLSSPAFSPNGVLFAAISPDQNLVNVWDTTQPTAPHRFYLKFPGNTSLAINSSSAIVAMGNRDGVITLWDFSVSAQLGALPSPQNGGVIALAYSPSGDILAAVYEKGQVLLWDLRPDTLAAQACTLAGRSLTAEEWRRYLPDQAYINTCAGLRK